MSSLRTVTRSLPRFSSLATRSIPRSYRLSSTMVQGSKQTGPPENKMVYFPNMTTSLPSETANFRTVLWTGRFSQIVLMTVQPGGDIGNEVHTVDQVLTFTSGVGKAIIAKEEQDIKAGDMVVVPAGTEHNFLNTGETPLILYTVYAPAEHNPQTVHATKEEGDKHEDDGTDEAPDWAQKSKAQNLEEGNVKGEE